MATFFLRRPGELLLEGKGHLTEHATCNLYFTENSGKLGKLVSKDHNCIHLPNRQYQNITSQMEFLQFWEDEIFWNSNFIHIFPHPTVLTVRRQKRDCLSCMDQESSVLNHKIKQQRSQAHFPPHKGVGLMVNGKGQL